jgi:hypothetical protein
MHRDGRIALAGIRTCNHFFRTEDLIPGTTDTCRRKEFGQIHGRVARFDRVHARKRCKACHLPITFSMITGIHKCKECGELAPDGVQAVYDVTGVHFRVHEGHEPIRVALARSAVPAAVGQDARWAFQNTFQFVQEAVNGHGGRMARVSVECCDGIFWGRDFEYVEVEAAA